MVCLLLGFIIMMISIFKSSKIILLIGILIVGCGISILIMSDIPSDVCDVDTHILKGIGGVSNYDSGLMSDGDTHKTTMLMESGDIYTVGYRINHIKIGTTILVKNCKGKFFDENIQVIEIGNILPEE